MTWHMLIHAAAVGFVAFGLGWVAGYGVFGVVFFPVGVLLGVADAYFKVLNWLNFWGATLPTERPLRALAPVVQVCASFRGEH